MLPDREYIYEEYAGPENDEQERNLRTKCQALLKDYHIKCRAQLIFLLKQSRNLFTLIDKEIVKRGDRKYNIEHKYTLRCLPDEETLMFSSESAKRQIQVCWETGCHATNPKNCNKHAISFKSAYTESKETILEFSGWKPVLHEEVVKSPQGLQFNLPQDMDPRKRIATAFNVLCCLVYRTEIIDVMASLPDSKRSVLASKLTKSIFQYKDVALAYEEHLGAFVYMDLSKDERKWKTICSSECCYVLAVEEDTQCIAHVKPDRFLWQRKTLEKILELGGVDSINEITENVANVIMDKVKRVREIQVMKDVRMLTFKNNLRIHCSQGRKLFYTICLNTGCGHVRQGTNYCPKCYFGTSFGVAVLKITPTIGLDKIFVAKARFREDLEKAIYARVKSDNNLEQPYRRGKADILFIKSLSNDEDLAYSWKQALIMYLNLESSTFGIRLPLLNKQTRIGSKFWDVFKEICAGRNILFSRESDFKGKQMINGYALKENDEFYWDRVNFTKVVYNVQVDELSYIGESSIRSCAGRDSIFAVRSALSCKDQKTLRSLLERQNEKGLSFDELPVSIVAIATAATTSPLYMETIILLAYITSIQFLMNTDKVLVNGIQSTCFLRPTWFEELQFVTWKLFGETIQVKGREKLSFQNTFLYKFGFRKDGI